MAVNRRCLMVGVIAAAAAPVASAQPTRDGAKLAINGYDTVAYFTVGRPQKGNPAISYVWDGRRYLFSNEQHRNLFAADPDKYAPQFGGHCASSLASGVKIEADPANFIISDGRLFLFAGAVPADYLRNNPQLVGQANSSWQKLK
jgi:YHS domain-containing protein